MRSCGVKSAVEIDGGNNSLERIGDDTILVNVGELKSGNGRDKEKRKKFIWEG